MKRLFIFLLTISFILGEKPENYVLLISFDGFREDYLAWYDTPNFDILAENGSKVDGLKPVFITKTFPNHYSIATGMYPENHGIIANKFYDESRGETYCYCNPETVRGHEWYGGEPIWVTAENQGVKTASYYWVGSTAPVGGVYPGITKWYNESVPFEDRVDSVAAWFSLPEETRPGLILLYFHEPDMTGHNFGPRSPETELKVKEIDALLGYIMDRMKNTPVWPALNMVVVSDHGMVATDSTRTVDYSKIKKLKKLTQEGTGAASSFYGGSKRMNRRLVRKMNGHPHADVYLKKNIPEKWHYRDNTRIKDILVVPEEGWSVLSVKNPKPGKISQGSHGYDNDLWSMHGIMIASGPAFKKGYARDPMENIHIYPLLAEILGLKPSSEIDGRLEEAADLLESKMR